MELYHPLRAPSQAPREAPGRAVFDGLEAVSDARGSTRREVREAWGRRRGTWRAVGGRRLGGGGRAGGRRAGPRRYLEIPTRFLRPTNGSTIDRLGRRR